MDRGDHQFHQGHGQGHGEGQVQTGFDTFVMTGDMIIKTTPKLAGPSTRPKARKPSSNGVSVGDHRPADLFSEDVQQPTFNGGSDVPSRPEVAGYPRFPDVPVELDIPPDDISSEDERYRMDCSEDLDISNLPPPPAEFFGDFSDPCSNSLSSVTDVWQVAGLPGSDGQCENLRNSLDEAIMRLESQTASSEAQIGREDPSRHGLAEHTVGPGMDLSTEKMSSARRANSSGSLVSTGSGVRASRSQDNWLERGGAGIGFVNIDVDGSSASFEALHRDPPTTSLGSLNSVLLQNKSDEAPLLRSLADDVRRQNVDVSGNSELLLNSTAKEMNIIDSAEKRLEGNFDSSDTVEPPPDYRDGASPELTLFGVSDIGESRQSSGQRLLGGGKSSQVRRPPPFQNSDKVSAEFNHHIPASWNNVADTSRPLKDVDHPSACRLAKRLYHLDGFRKSDVSKHLSKKYAYSHFLRGRSG